LVVKEAEAEVEWGVRLFYLEVAEEAEAEAEEEWGVAVEEEVEEEWVDIMSLHVH
jgi:hypothetical protein